MGKKIFSQLEKLAAWLQLNYMASRRTVETIEPGRLCFFPFDCREKILLEYQQRLKKLGIK